MADNLNPFLSENDLIENEIEMENVPRISLAEKRARETTPDSIPETETVSFDSVAAKLIKDGFVLSALEFHTELVESGRELPRLRDFFSNPTNFERMKIDTSPPGLPRTASVQTFDSLDFARYSDDGDRQENDKVAVLEFELRKAQETIKSLRAALTKAAVEMELSSPELPEDQVNDILGNEPIRQYERRALNFLVNEYMLMNSYKLTSVTFAEENENQDFEDWDDVGLNMPKPPDLLRLHRDYAQHAIPIVETRDFSCGVCIDLENADEGLEQLQQIKQDLTGKVEQLEDQIQILGSENEFLIQQVKHMERKVETADMLRVKSSTPAVSPINSPAKMHLGAPQPTPTHRAPQRNKAVSGDGSRESGVDQMDTTDNSAGHDEYNHLNGISQDGRHAQEKHSPARSLTEPEHRTEDDRPDDEVTLNSVDSMQVEIGTELPSQNLTVYGDTTTAAQMSSFTDVDDSAEGPPNSIRRQFSGQPCSRKMSEAFQRALLNTAFQVSQDNRIVHEVAKITDSSGDKVVLMLARCLPHIVPNVLLAKREELIPLILCTATLHPDGKERDQLLNILFNLIKRPDAEQRHMILTGCVAFAQHVGVTRVESELLPQCWEQLTHKYTERRLLVAEACGALSPYLPNEIRSSLVLSMLQQMMQDDKMEEVREAVVRSLGLLMGFVDDQDKYPQGMDLLRAALKDPSERVQHSVSQVLLPSFAMWALDLRRLESHLFQSFLEQIESLVKVAQSIQKSSGAPLPLDKQQFCRCMQVLQTLVPILFASILTSAPFVNKPSPTDVNSAMVSGRFPLPSSELTEMSTLLGSAERVATLVQAYEEYISAEWYEPWENYNWLTGEFIPQFINLMNKLDVSIPTVVHSLARFFYNLCRTFGRTFTMTKVRPKFQVVLNIPEDQIDHVIADGQSPLTKCTVPVYTAGILGAFDQEEDHRHLCSFLQDLLCTLSLCQAPLDSVKAAFTELCLNHNLHESLLAVLWEGVVHTSALVRSSTADVFELLIKGVNEGLVATRVVPALVTLANDPEISVRIATVPAFGTIMETVTDRGMLDKVHMQFQCFMDDPLYKDQHGLHLELIRTFARVGPNAEPRFRDDFVLPRLAVMSASNNHVSADARRLDVALQLFEAYSALSCCFVSDQLVNEILLPGLRCLLRDMHQVAPDHVDIVGSMIRELEDKLDSARLSERSLGGSSAPPGEENMKNKMLSRFKEVTSGQSKPNFSKIFKK